MSIYERILHKRYELELTKDEELARKVGISRQAIQDILNGKTKEINIKASTLIGLSKALNLSVDYLLGLTDE